MEQTIFNVLFTSASTSALIRNETHNNVDYMIVPVVALVEGVLHSANADNAELALAEEFGRHPQGWNGRPLVMNHPKVNGQYVSANDIQILEEWAFGQIFNTRLEDDKLKTEAWIDLAKVNKVGGEFQEAVDRIQAGEIVEISTGLLASVEQLHGYFNGQKYHGIWRNVVPDHLAFLSAGTIGACSVEGGCGAPRINQTEIRHIRTMSGSGSLQLSPSSQKAAESAHSAESCSCGCGGACSNKGDKLMENETVVLNVGNRSIKEVMQRLQNSVAALQANSFPSDMPVENVRKLLTNGLKNAGVDLYTIHTFTQDMVVYERWDSNKIFKRSFSINGDNAVDVGDQEEEVLIMTKIVDTKSATSVHTMESGQTEDNDQGSSEARENTQTQENTMENETEVIEGSEENTEQQTQATETTEVVEGEEASEVQANKAKPAKKITINEYVAQAPEEIQEVLQESLRLHKERKNRMVKEILANKSNSFAEDALKAMNMATLENIHKLAKTPVIASFEGRRVAGTGREDQNSVPRPMEAFPIKKREAE